MKLNLVLLICSFLFLPGCINTPSEQINQKTRTLLVQAIPDSPIITAAIGKLTPKINIIIKKELGLDQKYDFAFFLPKKNQKITLYCVNTINQKGEPAFLSALDKMVLMNMKPEHVIATSNTQFFGNRQDELVIMIDDPERELSELNQQIKAMAHQLNDAYHKQHGHNLYNIEKSERFPFTPHMGLGRIRLQSIKNNIKNASQTNDILERIKTEIKKVASKVLEKLLSQESSQLSFNKFSVLDLQKRTYIKEW